MNILNSNDQLNITSDLNFNNNKGINLANPTATQDISTKAYVDAQIATVDNAKLSLTGGFMSGLLNFGGLSLTNTSTINQSVNTTSSPTFASVTTSGNQNIGTDWRIAQNGAHLEVTNLTSGLQFYSFRSGGFQNAHACGTSGAGCEYRSSLGTISVPLATQNTNFISQLLFSGHNGTQYIQCASVKATSLQNWSVGNTGSKLQFFVTPINTTGMQNVMEIDSTIRPSVPIIGSNTTASTGTTTGSIVTPGGIGIGGAINGMSPIGGYYAQTNTVTVVNTITETSLIGTGVGQMFIPANSMTIGQSCNLNFGGLMSCLNNSSLVINLYCGLGGGTLLATIPLTLIPTSTSKWWGCSAYFTIRTIGPPTVGSISVRAVYTQNVDTGNDIFGQSFHVVNSSTFRSDLDNQLIIKAQWGTASPSNTIAMAQCVLTRNY